jgi:excisionase family DNA binding protein
MTEYIKPGKAAEMLGVSRDSIRRYADSGQIDAITTPGGQRRIDRQSVDEIIGRRVRISSTVTIIEAVK